MAIFSRTAPYERRNRKGQFKGNKRTLRGKVILPARDSIGRFMTYSDPARLYR